jgi:hypothetical protein
MEKHTNQPDITLPLDTTLVLPPETEVEINNVKPSNLTDPPSKLHGKK